MNDNDLAIAQKYLLPSPNAFWRWRDQGVVIEWKSGGTIAFRAELIPILRHLAPVGLPPLSTLLLVLAATRDSWGSAPIGSILNLAIWGRDGASDVDTPGSRALHNRLFSDDEGLGKINRLDPDLRKTVEAKGTLAEVLFEGFQPLTPPNEAEIVLNYLQSAIGEVLVWSNSPVPIFVDTEELSFGMLRQMCDGVKWVSPERLRNRQSTSLDQLPKPADVELPQSQQARALLTSLENDEQLYGLARLARDLMAAVTLPRMLADQEEIQIGGVSDITNRGPLDRLLLTELVHDDLTLAVRVSVNEALYLRRESPPRTPQKERVVLLEAGIRSWGVPRVFATAVALAMTATTSATTTIATFRADGKQVTPVNLLTRDGLIEHMRQLDAEAHPGDALPAFVEQFERLQSAAEPVIVASEEALSDPEFQQALSAAGFASIHLASVSRTGRFCLTERNLRGSKKVREAELNIEQLFDAPAQPTVPLIERSGADHLPVIFSLPKFPLRLSHQIDYQQAISLHDQGALTLAANGCLYHWNSPQRGGAALLCDDLPGGRLQWTKYDPTLQTAYATIQHFGRTTITLLKVDVKNSTCQTTTFEPRKKGAVIAARDGFLFYHSTGHIEVLTLSTGEYLDDMKMPPHVTWAHDRFFRNAQLSEPWLAMSYDGRRISLDALIHPQDADRHLIGMAECDGLNAPYGVTSQGTIYFTDTQEEWSIRHQIVGILDNPQFSQDGRRVLLSPRVRSQGNASSCLIDVARRNHFAVPNPDAAKLFPLMHPETQRFMLARNMRYRFTHIAIDKEGGDARLLLISRKKVALAVEIRPDGRLVLKSTPKPDWFPLLRTFKAVSTSDYRFSIGCAEWDDGSRAFLDSRGLLHLCSSDRTIPELSVTLADGEVGAWSSDARFWGAAYYTGKSGAERTDGSLLAKRLQQFIGNLK